MDFRADYLVGEKVEVGMSALYTLLIAMSPISELRGAIPIALTLYQLPLPSALFWSILGNMLPVFLILWLLPPLSSWLSERFLCFKRFFDWLFQYTRKRHNQKFEIYKDLALVILVAIPLPFTGAWTGSLAAFVFGIPYKKAVPLIFLGVLIAATLVTLATLGIINLAR